MTAFQSAPINLRDRVASSLVDETMTLQAVVDQLNVVTQRLHLLEDQIANGMLVVNEQSTATPTPVPLRAKRNDIASGWQPSN